MERRLLITGSTGYVGTALAPKLAKKFPVVSYDLQAFGNLIADVPGITSVQGDIRDTKKLLDLVREQQITDVIWLAGIVTDELTDMNVARTREINVDSLRNALDAFAGIPLNRFLLMSSSSVYGTTAQPATEDTLPKPMTAYAQSKLDQELVLREHAMSPYCAIRSATLMGPAPRMRLDTIVNVFSKQAWFEKKIVVHDGTQWRSNVHVYDVVACFERLLAADLRKIDGKVYNLVQSSKTAIDIAEDVRVGVGLVTGAVREISIEVDKTKTDNRHYRMVARNLLTDFSWKPNIGIATAAADNAMWFHNGNVKDPNSDIYVNTRRMAASMKE